MKQEYREGPEARKQFDEGMTKLFRAPKTIIKVKEPKPTPKAPKVKGNKGK